MPVPEVKTVDVGAVLLNRVVELNCAVVVFNCKAYVVVLAKFLCQTTQLSAFVRDLKIIIAGVIPSPCPTETNVEDWLYVTTLNPADAFTLTVEVTLPC